MQPDIKPALNPKPPESYRYDIGKWNSTHGPKFTRWFVCSHGVEGEVLYLCAKTDDPTLAGSLFLWHPDQGRACFYDTKSQAAFALWRMVMREELWGKYAA